MGLFMRWLLTFLSFLVTLGITVPGWAQTCARPTEVPAFAHIEVTPLLAPIQYDFSQGEKELAQLSLSQHTVYGGIDHVRGLTSAQLTYQLKTAFLISPQRSGGVCLWFKTVHADIGYDSMIVHVDHKYPPGSCQHTAILAHEREHVKINRETLQRYQPWITAALTEQLNQMHPIFAATTEEARQTSLKSMSDLVKSLLQPMEKDRDRQHQALDRPESYSYTRRQCPSW